ncbi:rhodanese-like domain-containing protein [Vitiosangium sp. GDMCC 1.1324]|uniref:rhodanese-like domain-containing protein n=1 Tax=Vitiosangium sp. (strain GDMCC 1.1324) TaxID=2138576 RepID=UPI000D3B4A01|nr:rhodanese-like domain-containing protein [Vitiosangium sp. GDMCC 1.1324]PTL84907.1 rhodanese-like domain-containing protein [Vitiosangium sp. GDMCC 1.1324]
MSALYEKGTPRAEGYRDVEVSALAVALDSAWRVDVREPAEFDGLLGHIAGTELVPLRTVETAAERWPRDAELVLVCRSGGRSGKAAAQLASKGFSRVMNLRGGMLAWNEAGLPVVRAAPAPRLGVTDVLEELLSRTRELGGGVPAPALHGVLKAHDGPPTHAQVLSLLELLQAAGQMAAKDAGAFERVLRECRDLLAVTQPEARAG